MQDLKQYFTKKEVSRPDTLAHMLWSLLITLVVLYFLAEAILVTFFEDSRSYAQATFTGFYTVLLLLLAADVGVALNRGIYIAGVLKLDRRAIMQSYLQCRVYVDSLVLLLIALSIYLPYDWAGFLRLVIFLKLEEVFRFDRIFFRSIHTRRSLKQLYLLFKLVLALMYVNHLLGCLFFYIDYQLIAASYYGDVNYNPLRKAPSNIAYWLTNSYCFESILLLSSTQQYLYSLYFSVSLLTTVAYGDITAKNPT